MLEGVWGVVFVDLLVGLLGAGADDAECEAAGGERVVAGVELAGEDAECVELQAREGAVVDDFSGIHVWTPCGRPWRRFRAAAGLDRSLPQNGSECKVFVWFFGK